MSSAINHKKRSHRSEAAHYHAARQMKGSPPRMLGLRTGRHGLGIMAGLRAMLRRHQRESRGKAAE